MNRLVLDLEFIAESGKLLCVGWKLDDAPTVVEEKLSKDVLLLLADPNVIKVCHSKADWRFLQQAGVLIEGHLEDTMVKAWVLDENTPLSLEYVAQRYCNIKMDKRITSVAKEPHFRCDDGTRVHLRDAPIDQVMRYNGEDVDTTHALNVELDCRMEAQGWRGYYEAEQRDFTKVLLDMECNGLPIDLAAAARLKEELVPEIEAQVKAMDEVLGYPLRLPDGRPGYGSSDLLAKVLFEKVWYQPATVPHGLDIRKPTIVKMLKAEGIDPTPEAIENNKHALVDGKIPPGFVRQKITPQNIVGYYVRKGYGLPPTPPADPEAKNPKPTTAMPVLLTTFAGHPFITELAKWSKLRKVVTTYLDAYPRYTKDGRLYGTFSQTGTKTGRISSARPNLMNQPAHGPLGEKIRSLFTGRLVVGDYGQLEPRLLAHFSQDEKLLEVYEKGIDVYAVTAAGIFGGKYQDYDEKHPQRKMAKPIFLGDQYGAGPKKLLMLLRLNGFDVSLSEVQMFQDRLHSTYSTATSWKEAVVKQAHQRGYVETLDGHRRRLSVQLKDRNWKNRGYGERQAVNAIIQGSAGDVVRRSMVLAAADFPELSMLAQVHDEVVWEAALGTPMDHVQQCLPDLAYVMEVGHGFDLSVPLAFDPQLAQSWADKGRDDIEWGEDGQEG